MRKKVLIKDLVVGCDYYPDKSSTLLLRFCKIINVDSIRFQFKYISGDKQYFYINSDGFNSDGYIYFSIKEYFYEDISISRKKKLLNLYEK